MTPERHQRIREIFETAVTLEDEPCRLYLAITCGGDDAMRRELEALVCSHRRSGAFLDTPAVVLAQGDDADLMQPDLSGRRIGRYELQRIIARGGMGIVYEAMQDEPRRVVAIKVMRRGLGSRSTLRRFQEESQILARLRHPNIAQVFEAGTHHDASVRNGGEAIPFFAMEYIPEARTITAYAREQDLSIRDRLTLFAKVCDAVHHGHQKGVIHRDLKPANILVDSAGEPKVIDFGVARSTGLDVALTTQQTETGQLIGTMQYMSPEQCDGDPHDIDSRSDVYSLGVLLYELLSGQAAYETSQSSILLAARIIRETTPQPLSAIDRRLRGDVETIVAKAMEKDRQRRYQSAEALKNDIDRHLKGEPIEARRRSAWVGATRWMGRHPILTSAAGATLVALIILASALLAIDYGLRRPSRFEYSPKHDTAWLVSSLGKRLATLGGEGCPADSVKAMIVDRPERFGGGQVALFSVQSGQHSTGQQVWMCDPGNLESPIWATGDDPLATRPAIRLAAMADSSDRGYVVCDFLLADVFPQTPEVEIVMIHEQVSDSPNVIRVYDFGGNVLFEVWHFGHVASVRWWEQEGLLIAAGDRHGIPEILLRGLPYPTPWPKVVMALRPQLGRRFGWVNERDWPDDWRTDPNIMEVLVWYKTLWPKEMWKGFSPPTITTTDASAGREASVLLHFDSSKGYGFMLQTDPRGEHVEFHSNDEYRLQQRNSEVPEALPTLVEWPPPSDPN